MSEDALLNSIPVDDPFDTIVQHLNVCTDGILNTIAICKARALLPGMLAPKHCSHVKYVSTEESKILPPLRPGYLLKLWSVVFSDQVRQRPAQALNGRTRDRWSGYRYVAQPVF